MRAWCRAAIVVLAVPAAGLAQKQPLLDLGGGPKPPAAGSGAATLALAESLTKAAAAMEGESKEDPAAAARAAARLLAAKLLSSGEAAGPAGSSRVLIGRTLARGMEGIDNAIHAVRGPAAEGELTALTNDLQAGARALGSAGADPWRVVRDAMAALGRTAGTAGESGWAAAGAIEPSAAATLGPDIDLWSGVPGVTPEAVTAARELEGTLAAGAGWAAYARAASETRSLVRAAAAAGATTSAWIPEAGRRRAAADFSDGLVHAAQGDAAGLAALRRLAALGQVIARADKLEDTPPGKRVRAAVAQALAASGPEAAPQPGRLDAFARALELAMTKPDDEKKVSRPLRPAYRVIVSGLRLSEQKVLGVLPDILARDGAMTDPAVLGAIAEHRRAVQDLALLSRVSAVLNEHGVDAPPKPGAKDPAAARWARISDRLLKLGQDMAKPDAKSSPLESLRELAVQLDRYSALPGEEELRRSAAAAPGESAAGAAPWAAMTGQRDSALLAEISDRRGGWLDGWDRQGYAGSAGELQRLAALRALMEVLDDLAPVIGATDARAADGGAAYAALQAWPGWELRPESLGELCRGLTDRTGEAVKLITEGDVGKTTAAVERIRKEYAVALLAGRLAREAQRRGLSGGGGVLAEVATGGPAPGTSWMAERAGDLAEICRYGEEAAAAWKIKASQDRAEATTRYVNSKALAVLEALGRAETPP